MFEHPERFIPHEWYEEVYSTYAQFIGRYVFASRLVGPNAVVLDLGCSCGYGSAHLAEAAGRTVVGLDKSFESLRYGPRHYRHPRLSFVRGCATVIPLKTGCLDAVVSMEMVEHVEDAKQVVTEVKRVLKPGGVFIASTPNRLVSSESGLPPNPFHVREYTPDELRSLLREAFGEFVLYGQSNTPSFRVHRENMARVWHNLSLLHDQIHSVRSRLEMDERITGLSLLRKLKRKLFGHQEEPEKEFLHPQFMLTHMTDWDITPYAIETAGVLLAVCRA